MGTIVLARLYTPSDLGLLAIFVSITSIMKVFSLLKLETLIVRSNSLGRAIINSKKVTQTVVFNFFFLLLGSLILFLSNYFFFGYEKNFLDIQFLLVVTSYTAFLGFLIVAENLLNFEKRYKDTHTPMRYITIFNIFRNTMLDMLGKVTDDITLKIQSNPTQ